MTAIGDPPQSSACIRCGEALAPGEACPRCGPEGGDRLVSRTDRAYAHLSAANLARMRGQWDDAVQRCVDALRLDPHNATAHSLLGDIYADQGRREEAAQWYQLALDLDAGNAADRSKLERLKEPERPRSGTALPSWVRVGVPAAVILASVMMAVGVGALVTARRDMSPARRQPTDPPPMNLPESLIGKPTARPRTPTSPTAPRKEAAPLPFETPREEKLRRTLIRSLGQPRQLTVAAVTVDPVVEEASVTVLHTPVEESPKADALLDLAYRISGWTYHGGPSLNGCKVRLLVRQRAGGSPEVALVARSTRESFSSAPSRASGAALGRAFTHLHWNPFFFPTPPSFDLAPPVLPVAPASEPADRTTPAPSGSPPPE